MSESDVLLIADLSKLLRCSVRTIRQRIHDAQGREPWNLPPRLPAIDHHHRWSRAVVDRWLNGERLRKVS